MIHAERYLLILMALFVLGCSGSNEDVGASKQSVTTPTVSQKAAKNKVTINPDNATAQSVITLSADTSLLVNAAINWYVNGSIDEFSGRPRFASSRLKKNDIIQAVVTRNKKEYYSNKIRIMNTPPMIKIAKMVPALPKVGATISVEVDAHDVDGDTIYYKYKWTLNGKYISDQNYLSTDFKRDDMIVIEITPYDSDDTGSTTFVKNKIFNTTPVVTEGTPSFDGKIYTYSIKATDVDGDILTYKILEGPEGMSVDSSGAVTWKVRPKDAGKHKFTILINDNNGGELVMPITTRIGFK